MDWGSSTMEMHTTSSTSKVLAALNPITFVPIGFIVLISASFQLPIPIRPIQLTSQILRLLSVADGVMMSIFLFSLLPEIVITFLPSFVG